jgi:hypothetical protein
MARSVARDLDQEQLRVVHINLARARLLWNALQVYVTKPVRSLKASGGGPLGDACVAFTHQEVAYFSVRIGGDHSDEDNDTVTAIHANFDVWNTDPEEWKPIVFQWRGGMSHVDLQWLVDISWHRDNEGERARGATVTVSSIAEAWKTLGAFVVQSYGDKPSATIQVQGRTFHVHWERRLTPPVGLPHAHGSQEALDILRSPDTSLSIERTQGNGNCGFEAVARQLQFTRPFRDASDWTSPQGARSADTQVDARIMLLRAMVIFNCDACESVTIEGVTIEHNGSCGAFADPVQTSRKPSKDRWFNLQAACIISRVLGVNILIGTQPKGRLEWQAAAPESHLSSMYLLTNQGMDHYDVVRLLRDEVSVGPFEPSGEAHESPSQDDTRKAFLFATLARLLLERAAVRYPVPLGLWCSHEEHSDPQCQSVKYIAPKRTFCEQAKAHGEIWRRLCNVTDR